MEFDEKELRREISYAIKNIHGIRHVLGPGWGLHLWLRGTGPEGVSGRKDLRVLGFNPLNPNFLAPCSTGSS